MTIDEIIECNLTDNEIKKVILESTEWALKNNLLKDTVENFALTTFNEVMKERKNRKRAKSSGRNRTGESSS